MLILYEMIIPGTLAIINCFGDADSMFFSPMAEFLGLIIIVLIVFNYFKLGKKRRLLQTISDPSNFETDILGQPKSSIADRSDYKTIDGVVNWRYILLFFLLLLGIALIYYNKPTYRPIKAASGGYIIEKSDLK